MSVESGQAANQVHREYVLIALPRARFHTISRADRRQLTTQTQDWEQVAAVMPRVLRLSVDR